MSVSKRALHESVSKQITDAKQIAKLMPKIGIAIKNAVGIEVHDNRYYFDDATVSFANLLGGYIDGKYFIPIRFGVKISKNGTNSVYVVIDQSGINKDEVVKRGATELPVQPHRSRSSYDISISQLFKNVNSESEIIRYIPDKFLNETQKSAKYKSIADTIKKTNDKNDKKYFDYIKSGNLSSAAQMVKQTVIR